MSHSHPVSYTQIPSLSALRALYPGLKALLFDMDGTLFDTERFHTQAFVKIGKDFNITPPHSLDVIHEMLVGKADHLVFDVVRSWQGFPQHWSVTEFVETKSQNLLDLLREVPAEVFFPGALRTLLEEARSEGIFLALVTSSEKIITTELLKVAGVNQLFNLILTRDDCPKHKPDPWPYLKALEVSGSLPGEAVVFEDSEVGIAAAKASGAHVIKVEWHPIIQSGLMT